MVFFGIGEKYRECMAQGHGDDLFGGKDSRADGADPRAEMTPDGRSVEKRKDLKEPLGDEAVLNMTMVGGVGGDFPPDLIAVLDGLAIVRSRLVFQGRSIMER